MFWLACFCLGNPVTAQDDVWEKLWSPGTRFYAEAPAYRNPKAKFRVEVNNHVPEDAPLLLRIWKEANGTSFLKAQCGVHVMANAVFSVEMARIRGTSVYLVEVGISTAQFPQTAIVSFDAKDFHPEQILENLDFDGTYSNLSRGLFVEQKPAHWAYDLPASLANANEVRRIHTYNPKTKRFVASKWRKVR